MASVVLQSFTFALSSIPENIIIQTSTEEIRGITGKILGLLGPAMETAWQEAIAIWKKMWEIAVDLWRTYLQPKVDELIVKIKTLLGQEIEKRKPMIEEEFQKEKQELKEEIKRQLPNIQETLWQKFIGLVKEFVK